MENYHGWLKIEATQYTGNTAEIEDLTDRAIVGLPVQLGINFMVTRVDDVNLLIAEGDYVVKVNQKFYPIKKSIFEKIFTKTNGLGAVDTCYCVACGALALDSENQEANYCPNCGAKLKWSEA